LSPHRINQEEALENQFKGMTSTPFSYLDYEEARKNLVERVRKNWTDRDKRFLLSFEQGTPDWSLCVAGDLGWFPAVQWKLQNIQKLRDNNPTKFREEIERLSHFLELSS